MKFLNVFAFVLLSFNISARDPGTGSNPTVGPGPATPDAGAQDTSVMGGGTPGSQGMNTLNIDEPSEEELEIMYQEEKPKEEKSKDEVTDQDKDLNTIED